MFNAILYLNSFESKVHRSNDGKESQKGLINNA